MILQKYLAWLSSTATLVLLSSIILPKGFGEIADWIGPVLGPGFRPELDLIFLVLGPSRQYTPLLLTWVAAGVVGGFFARGVGRAMAAGTTSTMTIFMFIIGNGLLIFTGVSKLIAGGLTGGFSGFNPPPPPPGLSLVDILNAPLVSQAAQGVTTGGGLNPFLVIETLVTNLIVNIVVYSVSFIFSGLLFSRILHRRSKPPPGPFLTDPNPQPTPPAGTTILTVGILLVLVSSLIVPAGLAAGFGSSNSVSAEQLSLTLQKDGTLSMLYSTNVSSLPGIPTDYQRTEFRNLIGGFLVSFNGTVNFGQAGQGGLPSFLLPLLPRNGFLALYSVSDPGVGRARADTLASEFGQGFGENMVSTVSLELPSIGGQQFGSGIYIGIYSGDGAAGTVGPKVLSLVQGTGVGSILTPQKVFVSNFGILAGFVNTNFQNATTTLIPSVQITADLTPLGNFYGHGNFTLGLRETLGNQGTIGPSTVAKTTSIQLGFPTNSTVTGFRPSNATLDSVNGRLSYSMNATSTPVPDVYVNFTSTFPQRIEITRQLSPQPPFPSGTTVTENIVVRDLGNQTIHGVVVSERRLFQTYPTLQLISGTENVTVGDIPGHGSGNATLQFRVGSDGIYTLPPIDITYKDQGQSVSKSGAQAYIQSSFNFQLYVQELVKATAPYSYLFLLVVVGFPLLQIPKLLRRRRKQSVLSGETRQAV